MNKTVLKSKLKRHKITYTFTDELLVLGKAKNEYLTIIGFIILPSLGAISLILLFYVFAVFDGSVISGYMFFAIVMLFGISGYNFSKVTSKKKTNRERKIIGNKAITIENSRHSFTFTKHNTIQISCVMNKINETIYHGQVFLVDNEHHRITILGLDDEDERYLENDLKWFANFITSQLEITKTSGIPDDFIFYEIGACETEFLYLMQFKKRTGFPPLWE